MERGLGAELSSHLGYEKGEMRPVERDSHLNGTGSKMVIAQVGPQPTEVSRDPEETVQLHLIKKGERRLEASM